MQRMRLIAGAVLGLLVALIAAGPVAAAPVPSLEGTWLVQGPGEGPAALFSLGAGGTVIAGAPGGMLSLPDGSVWPVASPGQGSWRSRGFPDGDLTVAFLIAEPGATTATVLRLGVRITLAETGQQWTGAIWMEALDRRGQVQASRMEMGGLTATRVLYGR